MLNRRHFLLSLSAFTGMSGLSPEDLLAQDLTSELHLKIAKNIKKMFSEKKELHLLYPKGSLANLRPIVGSFQKLTGIKVLLREGSLDEISSEILLTNILGSPKKDIDVALPATYSIPDLAEADAILDLDEFCKKHAATIPDLGYYPNGNKYSEKFYGFQTDGDVYLMFYNLKLLHNHSLIKKYEDRFGSTLKTAETWSELDQQIKFIHDPGQDRFGGNLFRNLNYSIWEYWMRLYSKGIHLFDQEMFSRIHEPASIEALNEMISVTKYLTPNVVTDGLFENFKSFGKGQSYCNLGWGGTQKYLEGVDSSLRGQSISDLPPGGKINGKLFRTPFFNWGWNYVVSKHTKEPELAFLFCLFAVTPEISTMAIRERDGYFDPFMEYHYQDPAIKKIYGEQFLKSHKKAMVESLPDLYLKGQSLYFASLKQAVYQSITEKISPEIALKRVSSKWNQITDSIGRKRQIEAWKNVRMGYPFN